MSSSSITLRTYTCKDGKSTMQELRKRVNFKMYSARIYILSIISCPKGEAIGAVRKLNADLLNRTYMCVSVQNATRCTLHVLSAN